MDRSNGMYDDNGLSYSAGEAAPVIHDISLTHNDVKWFSPDVHNGCCGNTVTEGSEFLRPHL